MDILFRVAPLLALVASIFALVFVIVEAWR